MWDLSTQTPAFSHSLDGTIVETLKWDLQNDSVLISASDDGYIRINDIRQSKEVASFGLQVKVENFSADPFSPSEFAVSLENGHVTAFDTRQTFKPLYDLQISSKAVTSVAFDEKIRGLMGTSCLDGTISAFNTLDRVENNKPKFLARELGHQVDSFLFRATSSEALSIQMKQDCLVVAALKVKLFFGQ